jgi:GTPase SAR1 family protein
MQEGEFHGKIAFAELVAYIDENRSQDAVTVFKLAELSALYQERLQHLGVNISGRTQSTRLKNRVATHYLDMKAFTKGRNVLLSFDADVGDVLHNMHKDFANLAETERVIRKEMFSMPANFEGSFQQRLSGEFHFKNTERTY